MYSGGTRRLLFSVASKRQPILWNTSPFLAVLWIRREDPPALIIKVLVLRRLHTTCYVSPKIAC